MRHGGRHDIYLNPSNGMKQPVPRHSEIDDPLVKHIQEVSRPVKAHLSIFSSNQWRPSGIWRDGVPACITIDEEARDYLPHMYGAASYIVTDEVRKLPLEVSDVDRRLTT